MTTRRIEIRATLQPAPMRVTLDDLLARFDPERHRHELLLDGPPLGRETF